MGDFILLPFGSIISFAATFVLPLCETMNVLFPDSAFVPSLFGASTASKQPAARDSQDSAHDDSGDSEVITKKETELNNRDLELWTVYWVVFALLAYSVDLLTEYVPLLFEARLLLLCWLYLPSFKGALLLVNLGIEKNAKALAPVWTFVSKWNSKLGARVDAAHGES